MAAAVTTALALCALLAGASALGRRDNLFCKTATYGDTNGTPVPLPRVTLPAGTKNWEVHSPSKEVCYPGWPVGYTITACDPNGPPAPNIATPDIEEAIVTRGTNAASDGSVDVTVYCAYRKPGVEALNDRGAGKVVSAVPYV